MSIRNSGRKFYFNGQEPCNQFLLNAFSFINDVQNSARSRETAVLHGNAVSIPSTCRPGQYLRRAATIHKNVWLCYFFHVFQNNLVNACLISMSYIFHIFRNKTCTRSLHQYFEIFMTWNHRLLCVSSAEGKLRPTRQSEEAKSISLLFFM